ncbi:DEAD/DEAH box helicase [Candidatus Woesebacteria bacterium]|nr:DEAD/DEAH box helicase [Candidatus Woesebacteria bacterium]
MGMTPEQISLYKSLFQGRDDVYARRWEKDTKSGWSPAYAFDWNEFNAHRAHGGTIKNFKNKTPIPFTHGVIEGHLTGKETIGIYPILPDNTSYFIVADFDETSWKIDAKNLVAGCERNNLYAYAEISRSGKGAHVWVFFAEAYPCWKARKIMLTLIAKISPHSEFQKEDSFDRLFPNQDTVIDSGFGNLIGAPLQGQRVMEKCTVFYDTKSNDIYADQWDFLKTIQKHTVSELDKAYEKICPVAVIQDLTNSVSSVHIFVDGNITLNRNELSKPVINLIKERLNIFNKEYGMKKRLGKSTFNTERYFHLIEELGDTVTLPRGFLSPLAEFLDENNISYTLTQTKREFDDVSFSNTIGLKAEQESVVTQVLKSPNGILVAPPGSGKTIMALEIIARLKLPSIILVHRNQLLHQWVERVEQFLGIPKAHIGVISGTKKKLGKQITVASLQSLVRYKNFDEIRSAFGVVIIDECHHIPAKTYRETIRSFNSRYCYGLTATHERKFDQQFIAELCIGPVLAEMKSSQEAGLKTFDIKIIPSLLKLPFRYKNDHYEVLAKTVSFDTARNRLIIDAVLDHLKYDRKILLLTERKEHIEILALHLREVAEIMTLSGDDSARQRKLKHDQITAGNFKVLIATGQLFGEGLDIQGFDVLVLAFPISFEGKLKQYIGRLRGNGVKYIVDIHDQQIAFLDRQFKKRQKLYEKEFGFNPSS